MALGEGIFWYINYCLNYPATELEIKEVVDSDKYKDFQPFLLNRLFSHHRDLRVKQVAFMLNKYIYQFYGYKDLLLSLYCNATPTLKGVQFIRYNKRKDEKEENNYPDSLIIAAKKLYGGFYSKKVILEIIDFLRYNLRDEFFKLCKFAGLDKKTLQKYFPDMEINDFKLNKKSLDKIMKTLDIKKKENEKKNLDDLL